MGRHDFKPRPASFFSEQLRAAEQRARNERVRFIRQHSDPMMAILRLACVDAGTEAAGEVLLNGEADMSDQAMRERVEKAIDRIMLDLRASEVN